MKRLKINNYFIDTPIIDILYKIKFLVLNGKLTDIKESDDELIVTCPNDAHANGQEKNPDCHINLRTDKQSVPYGTFNCFACGAHGDFVHFVALCFSTSDTFAKDWLIKNFGVLSSNAINLGDKIDLSKNKIKTVFNDLDKYEHWCPYLEKRKLNRNVCEFFNVKYDSYYRQIIFPVYDQLGRLIMCPRRSIDTKVFYLDKYADKPVYCLNHIIKNNIKQVMLVEGPIDALTCYSNNVPAIASFGSISDTQIALINKSCITTLLIATDMDSSGEKFRNYIKANLSSRILIKDIRLPTGRKDVNELSVDEWQQLKKKYNLPIWQKY